MVVKHGQWPVVLEVECSAAARRSRRSNPIRGQGRGDGLASEARVVVTALDGRAAVESEVV